MISTYPACSFLQVIVQYSSNRILLALMLSLILGCSEKPASSNPPQVQAIPPLGASIANSGPLALKVRIDLSAIEDKIAPSAKVFVFVREPTERMPLGVEHYTVATLPPEVGFTTTNFYSAVSVVARVSPSGKVEKSLDDFEVSALADFGHPAQVVNLSFSTDPTSEQNPVSATSVAEGTVSISKSSSITVALELRVPKHELSKLTEQARLFVIAKAPSNPIPLAVKTFSLQAIPDQLTLSDADAMMPTRPLSSAQAIEVSARLSHSGDVSRDKGDWEGLAPKPNSSTPNQFKIIIDRRIE